MTDQHLNCRDCPKCDGDAKALDLRQHKGLGFSTTVRRKQCKSCGHRWTTIEVLDAVARDVFGDV